MAVGEELKCSVICTMCGEEGRGRGNPAERAIVALRAKGNAWRENWHRAESTVAGERRQLPLHI